ncbi:uncharacterized protein LOC8080150 isoform X2 [Sorghum bicolor]|uniref:uncharacterized protein LOC8080150 isoform X2 n=1 Tax=Sorghum bicolor TaxID=4558 RepID=UPI000B42607A|nr:uncharacterized protein LOC8080150 isoform X2 [Sorghum bicolor]|eukprot:XP_021308979.1 uncharacterized protein LOC8080150 isoform X2 [Sorghum bicolor]
MGDAAVNHPVVAAGGDAGQSSFPAAAGGFVALDVGALSSLAGDAGLPGTPTAPPRTPVMRSLSRKGDRKPPPPDADANGTAGGGSERPQLFVHVAAGDLGDAPGSARLVVHTPLAGTPGSKSRRFGRRPAPWLDPRRVVFLFATLSSVGTLILLYFTLSMSRADSSSGGGGASDAR